MKNANAKSPKSYNLALISLDEEIKRIKEEYLRQFGQKFEIPHPSSMDDDEESYRRKIEEIKSAFLNKLPPTR